MKAPSKSATQDNRRGFVRNCLSIGASLAVVPTASTEAAVQKTSPTASIPYEQALSETPNMDLLGHPRSWQVVSEGLHPFAPERTAVLPGSRIHYGDRCGSDLRREIDRQIEADISSLPGFEKRWFPDEKRESIYWLMERISEYYRDKSLFRDCVLGLVVRELLGSTAYCHAGYAHEYQRGNKVSVDNPPVDWWLFLMPGGYDWAALDEEPIYAVVAQVLRDPMLRHPTLSIDFIYPIYVLTQDVWREVYNSNLGWKGVARMGRVGACRYLNEIVARFLPEKRDKARRRAT